MSHLPSEIVRRLAHCLEEEEADIYVMSLYSNDQPDLMYFEPKHRERIKEIFKILSEDTHRHADLLRLIVDLSSSP
jgi:hypothetical protein